MRDSERAPILALIAFLPFVPALVFYSSFGSIIHATFWNRLVFVFILVCTGSLTYLLLKISPQVGHYFNALAEFDRNYRYEKEAQ